MLSNSDYTKWEHFYGLNVIEFLNILSFEKSEQDKAKAEQMAAEMRRR